MLSVFSLSLAAAVLPLAVEALSLQECSACLEFCPGASGQNPNAPSKMPDLGRPFPDIGTWGPYPPVEGPHGLWWIPSIPGSPGHHIIGWWYVPGTRTNPPVADLPPSFFQPAPQGSAGSDGAFGWWLLPGLSNTPPEYIRPGQWRLPSIEGFEFGRGCNLIPDPNGSVSCSYITGFGGGGTGSMGTRPAEPVWGNFQLPWTEQFPPGGNPQPWVLPHDHFDNGMTLEVVEIGFNMAQFGIYVDGQLVAQSQPPSRWGNDDAYCSTIQDCNKDPFSRVSAKIPAGSHRVEIRMIGGMYRSNNGNPWLNFKPGMWRLIPAGVGSSNLPPFGYPAGPGAQQPIIPSDGNNAGGQPGAPAGQPSAPSYQPGAPAGQPGAPAGQPGAPAGQPGAPAGQPGAPAGQPGAPAGQPSAPAGQPGAPAGQPGAPAGQPGAPAGQPGAPAGQPSAPAGQPGAPAGQPGAPAGQDGASGGQGGVSDGLAGHRLGNQITPWARFVQSFDYQHVRGQSYPAPFKVPRSSFDRDTILEVVDKYYQTCHYKLYVDGQLAGETDEKGFQNDAVSCNVADDCLRKGYGHGFAFIPAGSHNVEIHWTDGPRTSRSGFIYTHNEGLWRLVEAA